MSKPLVTDRIDLLVQAQNHFRWCWDCGMEKEECERVGGDVKCCPDCRHPRVEKNVEDVKLVALGNYLCEVSNHCTCAAPVYGDQIMHESGCGLDPVYPLDMVQRALVAVDPMGTFEENTYRIRVLQYFVDRVKGALDGLGHDLAEFDTKEKP